MPHYHYDLYVNGKIIIIKKKTKTKTKTNNIRKKKVLTFKKKIEKHLSTHEEANVYIVAYLCYCTKALV